MHFDIRHVTTYRYDTPVALGRHILRMHPRPDGFLRPRSFEMAIYPPPVGTGPLIDVEGNLANAAWFEGLTQELRVSIRTTGETRARVPVLADAATLSFPLDYGSDQVKLFACLWAEGIHPDVVEFSRALAREADHQTFTFLEMLSLRLCETLKNEPRLTGEPFSPEVTLHEGKGSCRDYAVLFMTCCRLQGIAARFVSGYIPARPGDRQDMHAWAEVYLPGMGWQGYDATQGGSVSEFHIAVAAAADPNDAAPIHGNYSGFARSEMSADLHVRIGDAGAA